MTCKIDCPECAGTGFVRKEVELGDPDFGRVFPCPQIPARNLFDFAKHGIHEEDKATWDDLKPVPGVVAMKAAIETLLERGHGLVFLWGGPGQAKTVALKIAVRMTLEAKKPAVYTSMAGILENLRSVYGEYVDKRETAEKRLKWWTDMPLLAVDEFEKARDTEFTAEKRFALIDSRYEMNVERKVGMTILASNKDPQELDPYLASRIFDGRCKVVKLEGVDMRPAMEFAK